MQLHTANAEIQFSSDGKFANSVRSRSRATKYKDAANLQEYFNSGATVSDYRNDVSRGVFHFRDTQLWDLQANSAANWSTLGSGGEEVTRDYFRNFMLSFTNRSQRWTKSDHRKIRRQYEADRRDARLLHLTHKQYFAIKYQPESLIHATGHESQHLYGNLQDPHEMLKDYCLLSSNPETWSDAYKDQEDYSMIIGDITSKHQSELLKAARQLPWDDVNNVNRTDVMNPGQKSVKSFDLMRHYRKGANFRKMYDTIMNMLKSSLIDFDKHDYDSIQVNYNEAMAEHTDDINKGHSLCFAVGNYEGGELCINNGENVRCFDINGKILKYNGRVPHSVSDILNSGGEKRTVQ